MKRAFLLLCLLFAFFHLSTSLQANSPFKILDSCGEVFFDSGGPNSNYQNGENMTWTFCPDQANTVIQISFTFVDLEGCCDFLNIYDGSTTDEPLFTQVLFPATFTSTAFDGCLTVNFSSDFSVVGQGWEAEVECLEVPNCLSPGNISTTHINTTEVQINWNSMSEITNWELEWGPVNFLQGDGNLISANNPTYTLTDLEPSTYYHVYLRSLCPNGEFSNWTEPYLLITSTDCGGIFYDPGGPDQNYPNNQNFEFTFCPPLPEQTIQLDFDLVDIDFADQLSIYDGIGTNNPIIFGLFDPLELTSSTSDGCLTIKFVSNNSNNRQGWEAKVRCLDPPGCFGPDGLTAFNPTANSVSLNWFGSFAPTWDIEYGPLGFEHGEGTIVTTSTPDFFILEGLDSGTEYEVYIRANCSAGGVSWWSPPATFITHFSCGDLFFDPGGPDGNYGSNTFSDYRICPENPDQLIRLNFTEVDIEPCCDQIDIFQGLNQFESIFTDVENPISITSGSIDGCLIVFFTSDYENNFSGWEANIECLDRPNCQPPLNISLAESYFDSVKIVWSDIIDVNMWDVLYGPKGFLEGEGTLIENISDPSFIISDLEPNTAFTFFIRSHCLAGGVSFWSDPFPFSTYYNCAQDFFYDPGGPMGNYPDNTNQTWVFCPDEEDKTMQLTFLDIDVISFCCDRLEIFEGIGFSTPLSQGIFIGNNFISHAPNGCITVRFISDQFSNASGWECAVSCINPPTCPESSFLESSPISNQSILLDWRANATTDLWEVEYGPRFFPFGTGTSINLNGSPPFEVNNLTSNLNYDFYLRADCGQGDFSEWVQFPFARTYVGCEEEFTDSGGSFSNYGDNEFNQWIFCPEADNQLVSIDFTEVSVEACCDEISIYNGSGIGDPLLIDLEEPATVSSTSENGCLTVIFSSDISFVEDGWVANINCLETSIAEITSFQNFQLFPQPTSDQLNVHFYANQKNSDTQFTLLDLTGKVVWQSVKDIPRGENRMEIALHSFPNGIYFLNIQNLEGTLTRKVIKQGRE